ncbi:MAG: F0F1 ATP synthase subunit delta, partial [Planctomycetota bacterium]
MKPVKEAKKYAKTFISIVGIEDAPEALTELAMIENLMVKSREFRSLLVSPGFSKNERENVLNQVAERLQLSEKMVRFVMYLTEIKVIVALSKIIKMATSIYLEKKKRA